MYFAQTQSFDRAPRSQVTTDRPPDRKPEGSKINWLREPVEIARAHEGLPVETLASIYAKGLPFFRSYRRGAGS